ncbi:pyridoxamine 5'-phosphate oxidase family protein [Methanothrix sp.]|uniref:pyridoxamine 5'-phosphate oxidase family protein n=1 Tax=Methanothrix sp. TaxID=90426 RepID=UPI0032991504
MSAKLMEYFNRQPRLGVLGTASKDGIVDVAVMGSLQMIDEKTITATFARGRTFANLQENPNAVYMIMNQGSEILDWKGIRVYLRMREYITSGPQLESYKSQVAKVVGEQAAEMIQVMVTFDLTEVRPLIDVGQGWEKSI